MLTIQQERRANNCNPVFFVDQYTVKLFNFIIFQIISGAFTRTLIIKLSTEKLNLISFRNLNTPIVYLNGLQLI